MKKRVAVDARMIHMSGIGTYIKNNMRAGLYMDALGNSEEIHAIDSEINVIDFQDKIYGLKEQLHFPYKCLKKCKPDILHIPHYNIPVFYHGVMAVTIHDLIHLVYPEFLPNRAAYFYARIMIGIALKKAKVVITDSESTKKDIIKYYKKVNPDKICVMYVDVSSKYYHKKLEEVEYLYNKFHIPRDKKIVMYVGNMKPHKNLERLIQAFSKIEDLENVRLVLVGKTFDNYDLKKIEEKNDVSDKIIHTGLVTDQEIVDFYNLADLFVFPSLYEGFGLPPLEAMACGTPVIASNTSSIPEVLGEGAQFFDPLDIQDMTTAMNYQLSIKKEENLLVEKGYLQVEKIRQLADLAKLMKCLEEAVD